MIPKEKNVFLDSHKWVSYPVRLWQDRSLNFIHLTRLVLRIDQGKQKYDYRYS